MTGLSGIPCQERGAGTNLQLARDFTSSENGTQSGQHGSRGAGFVVPRVRSTPILKNSQNLDHVLGIKASSLNPFLEIESTGNTFSDHNILNNKKKTRKTPYT